MLLKIYLRYFLLVSCIGVDAGTIKAKKNKIAPKAQITQVKDVLPPLPPQQKSTMESDQKNQILKMVPTWQQPITKEQGTIKAKKSKIAPKAQTTQVKDALPPLPPQQKSTMESDQKNQIPKMVPTWQQPITKEQGALINKPAAGEEDIIFDRENMPVAQNPRHRTHEIKFKQLGNGRVEGYWADNKDQKLDGYKGEFPWPQAHDKPWPHQKEFLSKLSSMQNQSVSIDLNHNIVDQYLQAYDHNLLMTMKSRGSSPNRLGEGFMGTGDYYSPLHFLGWTEGLQYYILDYNVIPSRAFYRFVMNYDS